MPLSYDNLAAYTSTYAGIRARTELVPLAGAGTKIFPPTYGLESNAKLDLGAKYAREERTVSDRESGETTETRAVVLNSVPAQAHSLSAALLEAVEYGQLAMPLVGVDFASAEGLEEYGTITDLDAPHRVYDAILRDSLDGSEPFRFGEIGRRVTDASIRNATALFVHAPAAALFGAWDSTGPRGGRGSKFERAITSEIVATDVTYGVKTSSRIDPLGIERKVEVFMDQNKNWALDADGLGKGAKAVRPSEINHGNVKPSIDEASGGVTAGRIEATTVLSLIQLRRLGFPVDASGSVFDSDARLQASLAARATLAALGLAATVLAFEAGFDLRSRCVLAPTADLEFEAIGRRGEVEAFTLDGEQALALVSEAVQAADRAGIGWSAGLHRLTPTERLAELVRRSRALSMADPSEGE